MGCINRTVLANTSDKEFSADFRFVGADAVVLVRGL